MVDAGERLPDATVFAGPGEAVSLRDATGGAPTLFVFYLFDFSFT